MQRIILLAALGGLVTAPLVWAQDQDPGLALHGGEITIPSESTLEREAVTQPRDEFSRDDAIADRQMEEQNRVIDREVMRGICSDC
jgi:hypothetical protein